MRQSQADTAVKSTREEFLWHIEWTYDATPAPQFDKTNSDQDMNIKTTAVVTNTGTGIVTLKIPKSNKIRVISKNLIPATVTTGAQYLFHEVTDQNPAVGTCVVRFFTSNGTPVAVNPLQNARYQLTLALS